MSKKCIQIEFLYVAKIFPLFFHRFVIFLLSGQRWREKRSRLGGGCCERGQLSSIRIYFEIVYIDENQGSCFKESFYLKWISSCSRLYCILCIIVMIFSFIFLINFYISFFIINIRVCSINNIYNIFRNFLKYYIRDF